MAEKEKKLVITCAGFPPLVVGTPVLMANLFRAYRGKMEAVVGWEYGAKVDPAFTPPCRTHYLRFRPDILQRAMQRFKRLYFFIVRWFIYIQLKRLKPTAVFAASTPDGVFFVASFLACRKLKIPFWAHIHDMWHEGTEKGSFRGALAAQWEPVIFRDADRVFCMTEAAIAYYQAKYPRAYEMMPHCVPADAEIPETIAVRTREPGENKLILYTGNISDDGNRDALAEFVKCIDSLPPEYKIKFLTSHSVERCKLLGLYHKRIEYGWVSVAESQRMIREADVVLLPLSFKNNFPAEIQTVFSTKTLDYLVSGTPILVFSPPYSYHTCSAKQRGWGHVVEEDGPQLLASRLQELATDTALRNKVVEKALEEARRRNPRDWADRLLRYVENNEADACRS